MFPLFLPASGYSLLHIPYHFFPYTFPSQISHWQAWSQCWTWLRRFSQPLFALWRRSPLFSTTASKRTILFACRKGQSSSHPQKWRSYACWKLPSNCAPLLFFNLGSVSDWLSAHFRHLIYAKYLNLRPEMGTIYTSTPQTTRHLFHDLRPTFLTDPAASLSRAAHSVPYSFPWRTTGIYSVHFIISILYQRPSQFSVCRRS